MQHQPTADATDEDVLVVALPVLEGRTASWLSHFVNMQVWPPRRLLVPVRLLLPGERFDAVARIRAMNRKPVLLILLW
jgi:hypothetical protein